MKLNETLIASYGRLTNYTRTGEANLTHAYNGMDDRVASTRGSETRRFVYAPDGRVLGEYGNNASDVKAEYIWMQPEVGEASASLFGGDDGLGGYMPLAVAANDNQGTPQLTWVHANHMGVPIRYSDAAGSTVQQGDWQAPGFPGQSRTLPDLYYNRYRDYDPVTGRYIQADPIGLDGGPSPYSYALNNPIRYIDPDGRLVPLALCGIGGVVGGVSTVAGDLLGGGKTSWSHFGVGFAVGCATGVVAPVAATTALGAASLGALSSIAQYGLTRWSDGCDPTTEGVAASLIGGGLVGGLVGGALPKDPKIFSDLWKEAWKGQNAWTNRAHLPRDAFKNAPKATRIGGLVNGIVNWLLGDE